MNIVLVKYNAGNTQSVLNALSRIGVNGRVSDCPDEIMKADKVILPGVGEARSAMAFLSEHGLTELIPKLKQPVLGICLGLQLFCARSEEQNTECLGIFDIEVKRFTHAKKIPHMGWNKLSAAKGKLFKGVSENAYCYFVHSYMAPLSLYTVASCEYEEEFSAALAKDNFYAVQFHPEKSSEIGQIILQNFIEEC